jgi:serine phosphatase RsbU (regulator of sigma subunit)
MEAMDKNLQPFGEQRLCDLISRHSNKTPAQLMFHLQEAIKAHSAGGYQQDDATGVIVRINESEIQ